MSFMSHLPFKKKNNKYIFSLSECRIQIRASKVFVRSHARELIVRSMEKKTCHRKNGPSKLPEHDSQVKNDLLYMRFYFMLDYAFILTVPAET